MFALGMRHMREREKKEREIAKKQEKAKQIAELQRQQTGYRQISVADRQRLEERERLQRNASCPERSQHEIIENDRRRSASDVLLKFQESNANTIQRGVSLDSNERKEQLILPITENGNRKNSEHLASIPEMSLPIGEGEEASPAKSAAPPQRSSSTKTPVKASKSVGFRDDIGVPEDKGPKAKNTVLAFRSRFGSTKKKSNTSNNAPHISGVKEKAGYSTLENDSDHENSKNSVTTKKKSSIKGARNKKKSV